MHNFSGSYSLEFGNQILDPAYLSWLLPFPLKANAVRFLGGRYLFDWDLMIRVQQRCDAR